MSAKETRCPPRGSRRKSCMRCQHFRGSYVGKKGGALGKCMAKVPSWISWDGDRPIISDVEAQLCGAFEEA